MKKFLSTALILLASVTVFSQERTIQKDEFDAVHRNGFARYTSRSHRQIETSQDYRGGEKGGMTSKAVTEFAPPGAIRSVREFDSPSLSSKNERIIIAGVTYVKSNNAPWSVLKNEDRPKPPQNRFSTVSEQTEYKFLGAEKLNGADAKVYQKVEVKTLADTTNNNEMLSTVTTKYWFDAADGGILKQETNHETRIKPPASANPADPVRKESVYRNVRTTVWELDPNIKIEAPVITAAGFDKQ